MLNTMDPIANGQINGLFELWWNGHSLICQWCDSIWAFENSPIRSCFRFSYWCGIKSTYERKHNLLFSNYVQTDILAPNESKYSTELFRKWTQNFLHLSHMNVYEWKNKDQFTPHWQTQTNANSCPSIHQFSDISRPDKHIFRVFNWQKQAMTMPTDT